LSQSKVSGLTTILALKADTTVVGALSSTVDNKVNKNADIVPGTATKVTYDAKGLITGSALLTASDLPQIDVAHVDGLQTLLDAKMNKTDISLSINTTGNLIITWDDGQ
jgi:hypothetical protein